jgi:hypothetical protein
MKQVQKQVASSACLAYSSTMKLEATRSSEMSVDFQWITWHYIPEDTTFEILILSKNQNISSDCKFKIQ